MFQKESNRQSTYSKKWNEKEETLPFSIADMEFLSPDEVIEDLVKRAEHGIYGYTIKSEQYFEAITKWNFKQNNWKINKDHICHSPGIVTALNLIIQTFTRKNERIIIQPPIYYPFINSIENNNREIIYNELIYKNQDYKINFTDLEEKLQDDKVKLLFFCNPHNPVGKVWSREDVWRIGDLCKKNNVIVVSDEIHSDILLNGNKHYCMSALSQDFANNTITCMAPSKTFNLAGLQTSTIIIPNKKMRKKYLKTLDSLSLNKITPFGLTGIESAYKKGYKWLEELIETLESNVEFIDKYLKENIPQLKLIVPQGTYLAWIDCKRLGLNDKELEKLLFEKAKVNVRHSYVFGPGVSGFIRFNFACSKKMIEERLNSIKSAVEDSKQKN